jgi:hypothetical protein
MIAEPSTWNTTHTSLSNTMVLNSVNLGGMVGLLLIILLIGILIAIASSLEHYKRFWAGVSFVISSLRFTAYGGVTVGIAYGVFLLGSALVSVGGGIDPVWYLYGIVALVGLTIIGYGAEHLVKKIIDNHAEANLEEGRHE